MALVFRASAFSIFLIMGKLCLFRIVDFIANTQIDGINRYKVIYNNNLFPNSFFIKEYGTDGVTSNMRSQVSGVSFYWTNNLGNLQMVSLYPQMTQTAYNAFPMVCRHLGLQSSQTAKWLSFQEANPSQGIYLIR
jgi:hypothetical protein